MKTEILTESSELEAAWFRQYEKLARIFASILGDGNKRIVEIGCGKGQLTIPLCHRVAKCRLVLVDRFGGKNYSRNYKALIANLQKAKLLKRARIIVSDYMEWFATQDDGAYDAVISSEFLPEIDSGEIRGFMQECNRLLRAGGVTVHSFLSPIPRNYRQRLLIIADSNPVWTNTPPKEWFSPRPQLVMSELKKNGFQSIRRTNLESHLIMKANAARNWLKAGEVKATFYEKHRKQLNTRGLETPDWIIISGFKP